MAHTSVHALPEQHKVALALTLAVRVVARCAHEKCAAPGSTRAACIRLPVPLGRTHKLVILCQVHHGRAGALAQPHLAFQAGCRRHHHAGFRFLKILKTL